MSALKVNTAILVAADSPEKLRAGDAWRVYDQALTFGVVSEVKALLRRVNPAAFAALCAYESEEIKAKLAMNQPRP